MSVSVDYGWCWFGLGFNVGLLTEAETTFDAVSATWNRAVYALELYLGPWCVTVTF